MKRIAAIASVALFLLIAAIIPERTARAEETPVHLNPNVIATEEVLPGRSLGVELLGEEFVSNEPPSEIGKPVYIEQHVVAVVSSATEDVPSLIVEAARRWGVDEGTLLRVAWCESRWNPHAVSAVGHLGLFQFAPHTWAWVSSALGFPDASPFDAAANVEAAAWLYATQGPRHWGCK